MRDAKCNFASGCKQEMQLCILRWEVASVPCTSFSSARADLLCPCTEFLLELFLCKSNPATTHVLLGCSSWIFEYMWSLELAAPKKLEWPRCQTTFSSVKHIEVDSLQPPCTKMVSLPHLLPAAAKIYMQSKMGGHRCQTAFPSQQTRCCSLPRMI